MKHLEILYSNFIQVIKIFMRKPMKNEYSYDKVWHHEEISIVLVDYIGLAYVCVVSDIYRPLSVDS